MTPSATTTPLPSARARRRPEPPACGPRTGAAGVVPVGAGPTVVGGRQSGGGPAGGGAPAQSGGGPNGVAAPGGYADEHISHYTRKGLLEDFTRRGYTHEGTRYILRGELILAFRKPER